MESSVFTSDTRNWPLGACRFSTLTTSRVPARGLFPNARWSAIACGCPKSCDGSDVGFHLCCPRGAGQHSVLFGTGLASGYGAKVRDALSVMIRSCELRAGETTVDACVDMTLPCRVSQLLFIECHVSSDVVLFGFTNSRVHSTEFEACLWTLLLWCEDHRRSTVLFQWESVLRTGMVYCTETPDPSVYKLRE